VNKVHQVCPICAACNTKQKGGYYLCCACRHKWRDVEPSTVFQQITTSPEILAKKLVYKTICVAANRVTYSCWKSTITDESYRTIAEAIAATVKRLKEIADER
jgi:hypothetical protein